MGCLKLKPHDENLPNLKFLTLCLIQLNSILIGGRGGGSIGGHGLTASAQQNKSAAIVIKTSELGDEIKAIEQHQHNHHHQNHQIKEVGHLSH